MRIIATSLLAGVWLLAAALLWRTDVPGGLSVPEVDAAELFPEAVLEETGEYARFLRALWAGSTVVQLALLAALALRGPALARRVPGDRVLAGVALLLATLAGLWLIRLPFGLAAQWWRRRHDISRVGYLDWLLAPWLELLAGAVLASLAVAAAMLLARRLGDRWWVAGAPLLAVVGAVAVLAQPLVLAPRLEPLRERALAGDIRRLAERMGVGDVEVQVRKARDRTRRANAELAGIGPTRAVVVWDTLLDGRFSQREVRFVAAHELAHASQRHVWKGLAWLALLSPLVVLALAYGTRRRGGIGEAGAIPLAVLVAIVIELALLPAANAISRRYEAEADWIALEATRDPVAARAFFARLPATNLAQPEPPSWARVVLGTHPPLVERIAMARAWAATARRPPRAPGGS